MEDMFDEQEEVKTTKVEGVLINWSSVFAFFVSMFGVAYFLIKTIYAAIAYADLKEYYKDVDSSSVMATAIMQALGIMLLAFFVSYIIIYLDKKMKLRRAELRCEKNKVCLLNEVSEKLDNE